MENNKLEISKKSRVKGEDGHKTFSVRIKEETVFAIDDIATLTDRSRNELINTFLEYALKNCEVNVL